MSFTGEALGLDWANAITGSLVNYGQAMHYLYREDGSQTVTAGDSFIAGMWPNAEVLLSGDEAVVSWVVETTADSSGVLAFSSGLDTTWNLNDPGLLSESLGSVTVSGAQRIVLDQTAITAADIVAEADQPALHVQCTSGTVGIAQIRLRVWPPGGPTGGWAPAAGYTQSGNHFRYEATKFSSTGYSHTTPGIAWSAGRSLFDATDPTTWQRVSSPSITSAASVDNDLAQVPTDPDPWTGTFSRDMAYIEFGPTLVTGGPTGTGVHPDIVPGDYQRSVRATGGGALWTQFSSWNGGVRYNGAILGTVTLEATQLPLSLISGTEYAGPVPMATGGVSAAPGDLVPLPAEPQLVIGTVTPEWFTAPSDVLQESVSAVLEGVAPVAAVPDFEYWDPGLPWVPERVPRFFVKDHEEVWRPVGFGKPATDLSVFHVWTPVGWYRECRDGEVYSDAHPLKVKLYDGTWDTVAHMRPV